MGSERTPRQVLNALRARMIRDGVPTVTADGWPSLIVAVDELTELVELAERTDERAALLELGRKAAPERSELDGE